MTRTVAASLVLFGALAGATPAVAASPRAAALKRELGPGVRVAEHRGTGRVRFVGTASGKPISRPRGLVASARPADVARAFLADHDDAFGIDGRGHSLRVSATDSAPGGRSTVRLQQLQNGVAVLGGEFVVNLDARRNVLSAAGEALPATVAASPRVLPNVARDAAIATLAKEHGVAAPRLSAGTAGLAIYDAGILGGPGPKGPTLVWQVIVKGKAGMPIDELILVDAALGSVALSIDQIEHAKNRSVCNANNTASQVPCTAPVRAEGGPAVASPADVNFAYDYSGDTYDFFAGLGRDSLDNQGLPLRSTVRFCDPSAPCPYQNAFWDGQQMVYGQGFAAADDVVGHELTHGVTDFSAHLFYYYQSGAINESLSDVFGEFVDLSNGAGTDTAAVRWKMGEDIPGFGALRDMANPPGFGDPDRMTSPNYTVDANEQDSGGVHTNSGVNNKAAFLMTDGGAFNGRTVTGLGIPKVSRIYHRVQTSMLTSASDYADLASSLQQACNDLVGTAGIAVADCTEVGDAVAAVEMSAQPPAAPAPDAPVCAGGVQATNLFADNLENAASGSWSKTGDWYHPQTANPYAFDATYATSGTRNFWGYDRPSAGDYSIAMTAAVAIPPGSTAHLRFNHAFGFEDDPGSAYDGGVVEYSTNNGTTWTDAGPLLTDNGYTGTIAPAPSNALGGRSGFVRESNGYRSTRANLTSLAGQTVRFRFRIGTDSIIGDYGWFIDDVRIYTCAPPAVPDTDGDTIADATDNCPTTANTSQANNDGDGQGDACDPDDDNDTTADADDACPAVAASTASGCPPFGNSGSTTPTSGTTTTTTTTTTTGSSATPIGGGTTAVPTLATARVRSCRLAGRGRRARVRCTLSGFAAVRGATVTVRLRGRTAVNRAARPNVNGTLTIKPRRRLRRGNYRITITLRDSRGATRKLNTRMKVR